MNIRGLRYDSSSALRAGLIDAIASHSAACDGMCWASHSTAGALGAALKQRGDKSCDSRAAIESD